MIFGWTPLHFASNKGFLSVVEYLVNQKADVNAKNNDGQTALHLATEGGYINIVQYLTNNGSILDEKNSIIFDNYMETLLFT